MRYTIFIITLFLLVGCNLGNPTPIPEQVPTALDVDSVSDVPIGYWQMLPINEVVPTDTDIVIIDQFLLRRVEHITSRTNNNVINLEQAIQALINSDNLWEAENLIIESVMIEGSFATIRLTGDIRAAGGAIFSAVPTQFYLTAFEDPTIDSVLVLVGGENIANLNISNDIQRIANDVAFTREMLATRIEG